MRSFGIALAATLAAAVFAPATASAQAKGADAKALAKGMAEAPAVAQAAGLNCTVTEARHVGASKDKSNIYEVACQQGLGFVLMAKADGSKPSAFTCLEAGRPLPDGKPNSLACQLPGNADPKAGLAPLIAKSGTACEIDKARAIGSGATNSYFEVACKSGAGYVMITANPPSADKDVVLNNCLAFDGTGNIKCELGDNAVRLTTIVDGLNAAAGKSCQIKDKRYVLSTKDGSHYFEVACNDGKGYMYQQAANGSLAKAIDCAQADFVGGGCTLTDSRAAQTEQAGLYTKLATKAGFDCQVAKYGMLPAAKAGTEVVELQCSNRPDGAIAVFAAASSQVYDCVVAEVNGYRCSFTKKDAVYSKLTSQLAKFGKNSCQVSDARPIGATAADGFVEVACSDGLPGWVIVYPLQTSQPKELLSCVQAKGVGGGCKLPTNATKN